MITGQFVLGYRDQFAAFWSQSLLLRIFAWLLLVCFALLVVMAVVSDVVNDDDSQYEMLAVVLVGLLAGPAAMAFGVWRMSPQQKQVSYEIDDDRIRLRDAAGNEVSSPWSEIKACHETGSGIVLKIGPGARWLSKRAFAPDALAAFRKLARERLGERARVNA